MSAFDHFAIAVELREAPHKIMMVIRDEYPDHAIVFADAEKLRPVIDALQSIEAPDYLAGKRREALDGFAEAARGADTCTIPGPQENPLPVAVVNLGIDAKPVAFTDGITRTALLIELGANIVPLQAPTRDAHALHRLFGGKRPVEPVSGFLVGEDKRRDLISSYCPA